MGWVRINENNRIRSEGIVGVKQLENGSCKIKYLDGTTRILKHVSALAVMAKVTLVKTEEPGSDSP